MMRFREFVKKRKAKTIKSKHAELPGHQGVVPDNQGEPNDNRVLIGANDSDLPPVVIPPRLGDAG